MSIYTFKKSPKSEAFKVWRSQAVIHKIIDSATIFIRATLNGELYLKLLDRYTDRQTDRKTDR